jgi:hypothetical protein
VELLYPPEWRDGVPTSCTYEVFETRDDLDGTATLSGSATIDSVSTTFDQSSGFSQASNRQRCYLTATTSIAVGRYYLAANATSQRELVLVKKIASADYVDNATLLKNDYVSTDTFKGLRMYFTINPTFIAEEERLNRPDNPWRVLWKYTDGAGLEQKTWTEFDVVRVNKQHNLTAHDLYELYPDYSYQEFLDQRGDGFAAQIDGAWDRVQFDLAKYGITLDQVREHNAQDELHRQALRLVLAEAGVRPTEFPAIEWADRMERRYLADLTTLKERILLDKSKSGSGAQMGAKQPHFVR